MLMVMYGIDVNSYEPVLYISVCLKNRFILSISIQIIAC